LRIDVIVNRRQLRLEAEPLATAVDVLRDAGLFSVRETCALGVCGTCTVLLDGAAVSACLTPAFRLDRVEITTVEGLADGLHPVQQAFLDEHAFQCSFCTPGFVLATKALLDAVTQIRKDDLEAYLGGHLCRCGSYENIVRAVRRAALAAGRSWLVD
jgi:aerobic-type carbon monoxide dehydrogenase small subunit (CoxS/CutS family)